MEEQREDDSQNQIDAGRGVAKEQNSDSNKNTTLNQEDDDKIDLTREREKRVTS